MDPGIGPATGVDAYALFAGDRGDGLLQCLLHGAITGLRLPAAKIGAVVTENELDVAHYQDGPRIDTDFETRMNTDQITQFILIRVNPCYAIRVHPWANFETTLQRFGRRLRQRLCGDYQPPPIGSSRWPRWRRGECGPQRLHRGPRPEAGWGHGLWLGRP